MRATHVRDAALFFRPSGIARVLAPCGEGVIDWERLLAPLAGRDLMLSVEGIVDPERAEMDLQVHDPAWQAGHPDLTVAEAFEVVRLTTTYAERVARGDAAGWEELHSPVGEHESLDFIDRSARHLRAVLASAGLPIHPQQTQKTDRSVTA